MNDARSVLAQIRDRNIFPQAGAASPVADSPPRDWEAVIEQAVWEVSQPDDASPETVPKVGQAGPAPTQHPVSSMSVRHQRKVGLPVIKVTKPTGNPPPKPTLLDQIRVCRVRAAQA